MPRPVLNALLLILALAFAWPSGAALAAGDKGSERQCFRACIEKEGKDHREQCRKRCAAEKGPAKDDKCEGVKRECQQQCRSAEVEKCVKACAKDDRKCRAECRRDEHKCLRECRAKHPECAREPERDKGRKTP
jgi:hypothetical protein